MQSSMGSSGASVGDIIITKKRAHCTMQNQTWLLDPSNEFTRQCWCWFAALCNHPKTVNHSKRLQFGTRKSTKSITLEEQSSSTILVAEPLMPFTLSIRSRGQIRSSMGIAAL